MNPRNCAIFLLYASAALFCVGEAMERSSSSGFHQGSTVSKRPTKQELNRLCISHVDMIEIFSLQY